MEEQLLEAVAAGKLTPPQAESLAKLPPGAFCLHKSWGFGRVAEWQLLTGQVFIDFKGKNRHPMQAGYAADTLQPIPSDHIRARIFENAEAVREEAKADPLAFVRKVLQDLGGKATPAQLTEIFVPDVFDAAGFRKWWDTAKKKMKTDGHFVLPAKKTDPVVLRDEPVSRLDGLMEGFRGSRQLKQQIAALEQILQHIDEFENALEHLREVVEHIEDSAVKGQKLHAAEVVELLLARDEIQSRYDVLRSDQQSIGLADILQSEEKRLVELFNLLPVAKQRRVLAQFPQAYGEEWSKKMLRLLGASTARTAVEITKILEEHDRLDEVRAYLQAAIADRSISVDLVYWLCKERGGKFPELFSPDLFGAALHAMERDQVDGGKRTRLQDLFIDDRELLADLLAGADRETVRNLARRFILSTVFEELSKRSLLARMIKAHPEVQELVADDGGEEKEALVVSWASLDKRKKEYDELVNKLIPQNTKDISIARSYGDLRENFEFKSAKEQQAVLMRRKAELEQMLALARGTNFENVDTSKVSIGSSVVLQDVNTGAEETYHILGAWDSVPEKHIVSYLASIGQSLLGKLPGEEVDLPSESGSRRMRIVSISAFKNLELL